MHAIKATWTNGQIVPSEPVDWPEGSELIVEPLTIGEAVMDDEPPKKYEKIGLDESEWDDSPEGIAKWEAWLKDIPPMVWAEGEREEIERFREEIKQYTIEAVGKQMEQMERMNAKDAK